MIRIAIVDDEIEFIEKVEKITGQYFTAKNVEYKIVRYLLSGELMLDVESGKYFDIYLIDIEMPAVDGWDLAHAIRQKYDEPYIIFVTSHLEYGIIGYEYNAWRYITKDTLQEKLPLAFEGLAEKLDRKNRKYYMIHTQSRSFMVDYNDIYYMHKEGKYTIVHTSEEIIRIRKAINKVYDELGGNEFLFVDRGYVVNVRHVMALNDCIVTMRDGTEINASVTLYRKVKQAFSEFWRDRR